MSYDPNGRFCEPVQLHSVIGNVNVNGFLLTEVNVLVKRYKTSDGMIFESSINAIHHEKVLKGNIKECPSCNGKGVVDIYGDGRVSSTCSTCNGKGYVERVVKWE